MIERRTFLLEEEICELSLGTFSDADFSITIRHSTAPKQDHELYIAGRNLKITTHGRAVEVNPRQLAKFVEMMS